MKKLTLILVLILLITTSFVKLDSVRSFNFGVKRKVLLELFTATWCGPCAMYNHYVDETYNLYGSDKIILLRNQIGNDGLDTKETNNRAKFYSVQFIPTLFVNGKFKYHSLFYEDYRKKIDEILKTTSPISISINSFVPKDEYEGTIEITIEVLDNISLKEPHLLITFFEKLVNYEGLNGEKIHSFVIRDYIYDEVGEKINLKKGDILKFNYPFKLERDNDVNNFGIAAWIQDFKTFEVIQVESCNISVIEKKFTPPSPPTLSFELKDNSVYLEWTKPEEGSYPIIGFSLYKKIEDGDWNLLRNFDKDTLEYSDSDIESGKTYYYYIQSFDSQNNYSEKSNIISVYLEIKDTTPPFLEIISPPSDTFITNNQNFTIIGKTIDNESGIQSLLINNNEVYITTQGDFNYNVSLNEGENKFSIISIDKQNNQTKKDIKIICDITPPQIDINLPSETSEPTILISGSITDNLSGVKYLKINKVNISLTPDNKFSYSLNLIEGENTILIEAEDNAGNKITKENKIIRIVKRTVMILQINNEIMYVNNNPIELDVPPQIIQGRTYLPIRYILEPLGAKLNWDPNEKKVTIIFNEITIELWIGKNIAKVNGKYKLIDPDNPKVVPLIINGRTMLPVRFVAENLGCKVEWNPQYQSIIITYPED